MEKEKHPLKTEQKTLTEEQIKKVSGGVSLSRAGNYKCSVCGLQMKDSLTFYEHMKTAHGK